MQARLLTIWAFYWEKCTAKNKKTSLKSYRNMWRNNLCKENLRIGTPVKVWNMWCQQAAYWSRVYMPGRKTKESVKVSHHGSFRRQAELWILHQKQSSANLVDKLLKILCRSSLWVPTLVPWILLNKLHLIADTYLSHGIF